ncbi:hypothetical protein KQX54_011891 [Cotesia glomerata]|uniref:Methionyl/Leucyl tRNA synthetase domain-containing protein n=1 Tax=Cotesia glomerata TaxID=32391 RepID=A0AAV7I257_COTGL|nr:hypothetical protein KQX54_011891 [Cotesia glomerata]
MRTPGFFPPKFTKKKFDKGSFLGVLIDGAIIPVVIKIEPKIKEYVSSAEANWSGVARSATKPWLQDGLKPRCITRDIKWGIPVPLKSYEDKVFYEWSTTKTTSNSGVLSQRWTSRYTSS